MACALQYPTFNSCGSLAKNRKAGQSFLSRQAHIAQDLWVCKTGLSVLWAFFKSERERRKPLWPDFHCAKERILKALLSTSSSVLLHQNLEGSCRSIKLILMSEVLNVGVYSSFSLPLAFKWLLTYASWRRNCLNTRLWIWRIQKEICDALVVKAVCYMPGYLNYWPPAGGAVLGGYCGTSRMWSLDGGSGSLSSSLEACKPVHTFSSLSTPWVQMHWDWQAYCSFALPVVEQWVLSTVNQLNSFLP